MSKLYSQLNDLTSEIEKLEKENKELKEELNTYTPNEVYKIVKENKQLKQRISKLVSENTTLQNDLFTEQLNEDETDDYIDKLKNELFNAYLLQQQQERLISELKIVLSSYNNFVDVMFPD